MFGCVVTAVAEATEGDAVFSPVSRKVDFRNVDSTRDFSLP